MNSKNEETDIKVDQQADDATEIDLVELARKLWDARKTILRWAIVAAVAGVIIAFSIPKEYTTEIKIAPEAKEGGGSGSNLGALAAMAGINMGGSGGKDAVSPQLYPDIVGSTPFAIELFDVEVTDLSGEKKMPVRQYLTEEISAPWWSYITALPSMALGGIGKLFSGDAPEAEVKKPDVFHLTPSESGIAGALASRVNVEMDSKNSIISIQVTMQDPMVSAMLADTVAERLKEYVTDYRTGKARADMEYAQKLNDEARDSYYEAQQRYSNYVDKNQGIILRSVRNEGERLQNEMQLAFNLYNNTAQQLQLAKAKVQEITPVYTVVQPASVPLYPSKPNKMLIIVGCVFLAVVICCAWVLFGKDLIKTFKGESGKNEAAETKDEIES